MSMLNKKAIKTFILDKIKAHRPHLGIERVSADTFPFIESIIRTRIIEEIMKHPTKGKTFKPGNG